MIKRKNCVVIGNWLCFQGSAPSSLFQKVAFWRPSIVKWSPLKEMQSPKKNLEGDDTL